MTKPITMTAETELNVFPGSGAVGRAWETWCGMRGPMHNVTPLATGGADHGEGR